MDVPHALLDILRGCNITCAACYNYTQSRIKPLAEIETEVDGLLRLRRLQSISIVGGEPLLHPELYEVIRLLRRRNLHVELFTNGLLLDTSVCSRLKEAGTDLVFIHVDSGQKRPDLPPAHDEKNRFRLAHEKAALLAKAGLESGLIVTAYPDRTAEVEGAVRFALESPHLGYLLVTRFRDHSGIIRVQGSLGPDLTAEVDSAATPQTPSIRSHGDIQELLLQKFGFRPFAFLGSNRDRLDARWLSYLVAVTQSPTRSPLARTLKASAFERLFSATVRRWTGRYPFFVPRNPVRFRLQLFFNAISGGHFRQNMHLLCASLLPGRQLHAKRLLFQNPAEVDADGNVIHCAHCPDAIIIGGKLVPVCIADLHHTFRRAD